MSAGGRAGGASGEAPKCANTRCNGFSHGLALFDNLSDMSRDDGEEDEGNIRSLNPDDLTPVVGEEYPALLYAHSEPPEPPIPGR